MGAILTRIDDPRDSLGRATRDEVWDYAKANGVHFDQATTPKVLMEKELRARGLVNVKVADRVMGKPIDDEPARIVEVDADADLARQMREARQWQWEEVGKLPDAGDPMKLPMGKLRAELKRRGIKFSPRDKMDVLRGKLSEQNAT